MFFPQTSNTLRCLAAFAIWAVAKKSSKTFASQDDHALGYTPDTAYFALDGMFSQGLLAETPELTLNQLTN